MHWLGRGLCICGIALCVASCAQDKKLPEGVRVSVLDDETPALAAEHKKLVRLPQPSINASWAQAGVNPRHIIGNLKAGFTLKEQWAENFGAGINKRDLMLAAPVSGKNAVFVMDTHGKVSAFNLQTGKRLWENSLTANIGGFKDNYASDMTRTVFIGEVSDRAKEIYDIVVEANRRGIEAAKPGNRMCDVDLAARNYIEEKGYGKYFTHRTGHSIGLEDHEFGDVSSVNEDIIQVGQCFSVEPGIYLPDEGIGVRIEDLVIITEDGCEVLNHFTKDLIVVPEE